MVEKAHRFHGLGSLKFAYGRGQTVRGLHCSLKYINNSRRDSYRVAVVVSRRVSKSAVVRNRIRRRVYEIVRLESTKITKPYDLVFTVFDEQLATIENNKLQVIITELLQKAGVIEN